MPETYTEVTRKSWLSRLGGALKGVLFGFVLLGVAVWVLFANEGRAVRRSRALAEGASSVQSVAADRIDTSNEGKLIHVSGLAGTTGTLRDEIFGVEAQAIHLDREVEMYQWLERRSSKTEKKLGGSTETTTEYSYERDWSSSHSRSDSFKVPAGHENPASWPYDQQRVSAPEVTLGAFRLSPGLIDAMNRSEPLSVEPGTEFEGDLRWTAQLHDGGIYIGRSPASPEVGDIRVVFKVVRPAVVSVVAGQEGNTLVGKEMSNGGRIQLLSYGEVPADMMFESAEESNRIMTWILRALGFLMMAIGFKRIFRPLSVTADLVPAAGNLVGSVTGFLAYLLAAGLSLIVVAVAWLYYRPVLAVVLLVVGGGATTFAVWMVTKAMRRGKAASEASRA